VNFSFNFNPPEKLLRALISQKAVKIIGFTFLTIGLYISFMAIKIHIDERDAQNWTPHAARILSANIRTHVDDENGFKSYSVNVNYQYKWENVLYQGDQYRLHDNSSSGFDETNKIVQNILNAKQEKEDYPIYVNPKKPKMSAVKNEVNGEAKLVMTIFGIIFPLAGFFMFFFPHLFNQKMP